MPCPNNRRRITLGDDIPYLLCGTKKFWCLEKL
jgi:hypothetical protein